LNEVSTENQLIIGKVIRPHGLNGLLKIRSFAESGESFLNAGIVLLKPDRYEASKFKVMSITAQGNAFLLKLQGISSLEAAERYRGADILIRKETLTRENDEYFWFELIGLEVFLESGRFIGVLQDIINTGSNDIYVVKEGKEEFLIPALHGVVMQVDLGKKRMLIADNIDGLFD
jgi:16S rRNA processing protein RimM